MYIAWSILVPEMWEESSTKNSEGTNSGVQAFFLCLGKIGSTFFIEGLAFVNPEHHLRAPGGRCQKRGEGVY